ncbi:MAG: acetoacetate--CoA ligase, partial [Phycisphaerales bacterium]|nr:acetoacetate--CoA ligase [Phycisphaerales bacterium]
MAIGQPLWTPSRERVEHAQMNQFMRALAARHGFSPQWEPFREWSIARRDLFWEALRELASVEFSAPAESAVSGSTMLNTRWFPGATLNYARHMLRFEDDRDAILFEHENGRTVSLTHRELRAQVARCAAALRRDGVTRGDRVAGLMPNCPEAIIAMLAAASIGAIWSSCSPDFGTRAALDRFGQIAPAVLVVPDGYTYNAKGFSLDERIAEMLRELKSVRAVVVAPYLHGEDAARVELPVVERTDAKIASWGDYIGIDSPAPPLTFDEVPFDHPLFIMYSSGTTGVPKCIVHGHGGTLLQHMKELMLHCDLRAGERIFYFTTCGWMMWNWLVSGIGVGAAVVLYDGNPAYPNASRLWKLAERVKINVFGTSPKFLAACQKSHIQPGVDCDLSSLRAVLSTGSPLSEDLFHWTYDNVRRDLQLSSISGGTDIISCFMLGNPILPVHAGEIQCRGLAMDVRAWDEHGRPVIGQKGELMCCSPFPSQPVGFWNDPDGAKYRKAYFDFYTTGAGELGASRAAPVWRHGDYVEIRENGGVVVYGRSDATLNPGGVRIGTAEIYRLVESVAEVVDSIACAKKTDDDEEIALFVVLRPGLTLSHEIAEKIRAAISSGATKRHLPRYIHQVSAIPYTISGKKVELAVQQQLHGE